jgi:tetratricopeptide (TPR) repeat protein
MARRLTTAAALAAVALLPACRERANVNPLNAGIVELEKGRPAKAVKWLEKAVGEEPGSATACANLGIAYYQLKKTEAALEQFQKAANLAPKDARALEYVALIQVENGRWNEAREALVQAYQRVPLSPRVLTAMANVELQLKGADAALPWLKQALAVSPPYAPALYNMAVLQRDAFNNPAEAQSHIERYRKVAGKESKVKDVRRFLSERAPLRAGAAQRAESSAIGTPALKFKKQTARDTAAAIEANRQGLTYYQQRDWNRAIYYFTRAVESDPLQPNAYYNLGLAYRENGEGANARDAFIYALDLKPDLHNARYMLALALKDLHQTDSAIGQLNKVLAAQPSHADAQLALGLIYYNKGNRALSRKHLKAYLDLLPQGQAAAEVRKLLSAKR